MSVDKRRFLLLLMCDSSSDSAAVVNLSSAAVLCMKQKVSVTRRLSGTSPGIFSLRVCCNASSPTADTRTHHDSAAGTAHCFCTLTQTDVQTYARCRAKTCQPDWNRAEACGLNRAGYVWAGCEQHMCFCCC